MSGFGLYLLFMLDSIIGAAVVLMLVSTFCVLMVGAYAAIEESKPALKYLLRFLVVALISGAVATFTPSTKQMAAIIIVPAIVNNEQVQQIPQKVLDILDLSLDEIKASLEEKK